MPELTIENNSSRAVLRRSSSGPCKNAMNVTPQSQPEPQPCEPEGEHDLAWRSSRRKLLRRAAGVVAFAIPFKRAAAESTPAEASMAGAELREAERRAAVCSASNVAGTGLRGEYFAADGMRGQPLLVRVDSTVDFDRTLDWPTGVPSRPRSAQWTGWIKAPITGPYRFHSGQQRSTIVIARQTLLRPESAGEEAIDLTAGRFYPLLLQVERLDLMAQRLKLEWTAPFGARYVIPRSLLYVPTSA